VVSVEGDGPGGGGGMFLNTSDADVNPAAGSDIFREELVGQGYIQSSALS
jgi:hypothetical protein